MSIGRIGRHAMTANFIKGREFIWTVDNAPISAEYETEGQVYEVPTSTEYFLHTELGKTVCQLAPREDLYEYGDLRPELSECSENTRRNSQERVTVISTVYEGKHSYFGM